MPWAFRWAANGSTAVRNGGAVASNPLSRRDFVRTDLNGDDDRQNEKKKEASGHDYTPNGKTGCQGETGLLYHGKDLDAIPRCAPNRLVNYT